MIFSSMPMRGCGSLECRIPSATKPAIVRSVALSSLFNRTAGGLLAIPWLFSLTAMAQSNIAIDVTYDPNVPAAAQVAFNNVVSIYQSLFTNSITVNIHVQFGNVGLGHSLTKRCGVSYATWRGALDANSVAHGENTFAAEGIATLPATNPFATTLVAMRTANARALGFSDSVCQSTPADPDSTLTFTNVPGTFEYTGIPTPGLFDFQDSAEHELNEALGIGSRLTGLANNDPVPSDFFEAEDYFRYGLGGTRLISTDPAAKVYFSFDGGQRLFAQFNQDVNNGDRNDWIYACLFIQDTNACVNSMVSIGSPSEITVLQTLGYNPVPLTPASGSLFLSFFGS